MIAYRRFAKRFGAQVAVTGLTLDVARGEVVALLGPNGSGKTTSIKAAAGLVRPTSGDVLIGEPARPASEAAARRACSFLPQKVSFPNSLTAVEVLEFYCALRGRPAARAADALSIASLNGASRRAVGTYSGGMTQRLGLAVALMAEAPLLLLDEPTAALDPDGLRAFYELIERRRTTGQTVLFSSHQMGDVERLADRFAVLVAGRLVATFTGRELGAKLADRGVMKVTLDRPLPAVFEAVQRLAPAAAWAGEALVVPGPASARPAVLDAILGAGGIVTGLTAEEGRLDEFYRELVEGEA